MVEISLRCGRFSISIVFSSRIVAAIIENNSSTEGIKIPKILQDYTGFKFIS